MPLPVKISDRLLALAKEERRGTHRSMTALIEHWATLGRAVEATIAYGDVLDLKSLGQTLPPRSAYENARHAVRTLAETDRERIKARIQSAGTPVYMTDSAYPGKIVEVRADGTRTPGRMEGRRFVADSPRLGLETAIAAIFDLPGRRLRDASIARRRLPEVEGRWRMRLSGVTVAWRGTPNLDNWVVYIVNGPRSRKAILAERASEQQVKTLIARLGTLSRKEIENLPKR
jgi:ParD-like antitoxin of type II bacterial toxin-antitoxin system